MNTYKKEFALRYGHEGKLHNLNCEMVVVIDGLATVVHVKTDDPEIIAYVGGGRENRLLRGQATCNPHDTYSEETGIKLAFRRALMTAHILRYPGGVSLTPKGKAIYSAFRRGYKAIWEPAVIAQWTGTGTAWDRVNNIMVDYGPVEPKPDPEPYVVKTSVNWGDLTPSKEPPKWKLSVDDGGAVTFKPWDDGGVVTVKPWDEPKPEPVDDTKPIPCPDCGEVPELAHLVRKVWSCTCHCSLGSAGRGHTEAQAIARWNAAARVK